MAESKDNYVIHGMSGKLGNLLVFKQWFGRTIVGKRPRKTDTVTTAQQGIRDKFQLAAAYAKAAFADTPTKNAYKSKTTPGQTAFNLAISDFFIAPTITDIDTSGYTGEVGGKIKIAATDDFMVKTVDVVIAKADGSIIEQGAAVADADGVHWVYTATLANAALSGTKITATAKDLPANMTVKDKILA